MPFTRRRLLVLTGTSLLLSLFTWWQRRATPVAPVPEAASMDDELRAWVDTLMPAEPDFPGALALGVGEKILAASKQQAAYASLTSEAMIWLAARTREAGGKAFSALPEARRAEIVTAAASSAMGSAERTFFQATLDDTLFHAYADPRAWTGLGYAGPPQPIGFPDHAAAPRRS